MKVNLRGGFSDRHGISPVGNGLQIDTIDERSRKLLVADTRDLWRNYIPSSRRAAIGDGRDRLISDTYVHVFLLEEDEYAEYSVNDFLSIISETILNETYDSVLTLIEFLARRMERVAAEDDPLYKSGSIFARYNRTFECELIQFRFVAGLISPITDKVEIDGIQEALCTEHNNIKEHFEKALRLISSRDNPDYENSIKESISAVEAMCRIIVKDDSATLGNALDKLKQSGIDIHPALLRAYHALYGFTSDHSGIRHAGRIGESSATFAEAKYMLVSCTAFTNYLTTSMSTESD